MKIERLAVALVASVVVGSIIGVLTLAHRSNSVNAGSPCASDSFVQSVAPCSLPGVYATYETTVYKFDIRTGGISWQYATSDRIHPFSVAPTVVGNTVYISSGNAFYALDANTGAERWKHQWGLSLPGSSPTPIIGHGIVAIDASDNTLHVMDMNTGKELWSKNFANTESLVAEAPSSVTTDALYVASSQGNAVQLSALRTQDGTEIWKTNTLSAAEDSGSFQITEILVAGNTIYASFSHYTGGGFFRAFDTHDGRLLWSVPLETDYLFTQLQISNSIAYLTANPLGKGKPWFEEAYDTQSGTHLWSAPVHSQIRGNPILENNTLIFSTQNGFIYALNAQSGKQRWSHHADGDINLTTVNQNMLYVEVGTFHILQGAMGVPPQFIPRYLLALNNTGVEQHRYPLPQGFYPYELAVGTSTIFLIGSSSNENFDDFHDLRAFSTATGTQLWQNKIRNLPTSGLFSTVVP